MSPFDFLTPQSIFLLRSFAQPKLNSNLDGPYQPTVTQLSFTTKPPKPLEIFQKQAIETVALLHHPAWREQAAPGIPTARQYRGSGVAAVQRVSRHMTSALVTQFWLRLDHPHYNSFQK